MTNLRVMNRCAALAVGVIALLANAGAALASTATISSTPKQTIKGWGCFPSYFRSDWGSTYTLTGRTAIQDAIYAMGITHIRVDVQARLYVSGTTVSNIVLDTTSMNDLVNQITYARNHGVTQYIMSCWSPPAVWKDNGSVDGGHLIPADEPYYVAFYTKVLQTLNSRGVGLPVAISVQNEPDISAGYDSCVYNDTSANIALWATVVKDMRSSFNANGMSGVTIFGVEASNTDNDTNMLGGDGLPTLGSDPTLNTAMGAYATHGYSECYWTGLKDGMATRPKDAWVTEWSAINGYGTTEMSWLIPTFEHFGSNMVDLPFNYWTWWRGWSDTTTAPGDEDLLGGDTSPIYSKRYYVFQKLWNAVRPGWVVKPMTCDNGSFTTSNSTNPVYQGHGCDTFVDLVGFEPAAGTSSAVLMINPTGGAVSMITNGLKGATYIAYQTDSSHDMANVASGSVSSGSATVNLTANSVTIIVTAAGSGPPPAPAGLTATAGNSQVSLSWSASSGATSYNVKRSTVSGSGYVAVSSPTTTSYTNTGLTNGTTYYFVVTATNSSGTSGNSNQASATPTSGGSGGNTHGGTWALKAVMTTTPSYTNAWETVSVASNSTYVASFWIKGTGAVMLKVLNGNWGTEIAEVRGDATSTWQQFSLPAFNTGSNTQLTYVLQDQYGVAGTAYLDDTFLGISGGSNTLANPGFESGNVNWSPSGAFSIVQPGGTGNTHGGTWACKAVMTTTPSYTNAWETVSVASNSTYVASFWIKGSGAVMLKVLNGNWGAEIAEVRGNATSTWQQFSLPAFNTGANTQLTYVLQDQYGVAGTAYLDDAFLGVSGGSNTLVNPGFESGNVNWGPSGAFTIVQNP